ncbi:AP2 domain-containing protein [Lactiplantibacillus plantarum]|uniref:AP2 domain-containing protein n=1 Tax=Lactiplantibacillus plantarum TaxID=1590 RepID=UPI00325C847A
MIDLTGQKFGRLTVIRKAHRKIDHHVAWVCQCVCGNKTETTTRNLQSGNTKSCGCLQRENSSKLRRVNLLGKRFGRLLVIEEEPSKVGDHIVFWKCQCDCGNIVLHNTGTLTSGNTQSCGCLKKDNLKKLIDNNAKDGTMLNQIADTRRKNKNNKSGITGVSWDSSRSKWAAKIVFKQKAIYLGRFDNKRDAINARKKAEEKYFHPILDKFRRDKDNLNVKNYWR